MNQTVGWGIGWSFVTRIRPDRLLKSGETRTTPRHGNGTAGSIRAPIPENAAAARQRHSTRPRAEFEDAGRLFLSKRTEADFQAWRDQRYWTDRKYALWDAGQRLDPPSHSLGTAASRFMKCPCGEVFGMGGPAEVVHVRHIARWRHQGHRGNRPTKPLGGCRPIESRR
jgi:hypothetical protein